MARIFVVRHGQTHGNLQGLFCGHSETELTPVGIAQAQALGRKLASVPFDAAYASDLSRAGDTAAHILANHPSPPPLRIDPRLREMHYGEWEAVPAKDLRERHPELMADFLAARAHSAPGGETIARIRTRMAEAVRDAAGAHPEGKILVVTHGQAIMALLAELLAVPLEASWSFAVENTSVTRLHIGRTGRTMVLSFNEMSHTDGLDGHSSAHEEWD